MLTPTGFWSYTTSDETGSRGRLSQLRALLAAELQLKVGRNPTVRIFQDVVAIPPGAEWDRQIYEAIEHSSFLIPIVTPGFLQSEWCAQEVMLFREREMTLGVTNLIFPFHYVDVGHVDGNDAAQCHDATMLKLLRTRQWTDFRHLRFRSQDSEEISLVLAGLAQGILCALREAAVSQRSAEVERQAKEAEATRAVEEERQQSEARATRSDRQTPQKESEVQNKRDQAAHLRSPHQSISSEAIYKSNKRQESSRSEILKPESIYIEYSRIKILYVTAANFVILLVFSFVVNKYKTFLENHNLVALFVGFYLFGSCGFFIEKLIQLVRPPSLVISHIHFGIRKIFRFKRIYWHQTISLVLNDNGYIEFRYDPKRAYVSAWRRFFFAESKKVNIDCFYLSLTSGEVFRLMEASWNYSKSIEHKHF